MTHVTWRPALIPDLFANASDVLAWQVFNRRASSAALSFGLFPAISSSGATGDSDQVVLPGLAFQPHLPAPFDVRAGAGVTVTRDAQGFTIAAPGGTSPESDQSVLPGREFSGNPIQRRALTVQAGTNITVTENALGPVISTSALTYKQTLAVVSLRM